MSPLPILSLPYVARIAVYQKMGCIGLFDLSICSKRMKRIMKSELSNKQVFINMRIDNYTTFDIGQYRVQLDEVIFVSPTTEWRSSNEEQSRNIGNFKNIRSTVTTKCLDTHWPDTFTGGKTVFRELSNLFKIKVQHLTVDMDKFKNKLKEVIAWINTISHQTDAIVFEGKTYNFTDYKWILENVTSPGSVCTAMEPMNYEEVNVLNVSMQSLSIEYASWIQLKHILEFDFKTFTLNHLSLTGNEMNQYLKRVVAGDYPKLDAVHFVIHRDLDLDEILDGLSVIKGNGRRVEFLLDDGKHCRFLMRNFNPFFSIGIQIVNRKNRRF